jgi:hypothetical protein
MAKKKKTRKKLAQSRKTAGPKRTAATKRLKARTGKKSAKKAAAPNKASAKKKKKTAKKTVSAKAAVDNRKKTVKTNQGRGPAAFSRETSSPRSGAQAGDLQGLSDVETADSESVDELIEEGNAFEAGVVEGVEDAGERGVREVHTREVPEDDVPGEYLDED